MKKFVCSVCGYVHEGDAAPEVCPLCGVPASDFVEEKAEEAAEAAVSKYVCPVCGNIVHAIGDTLISCCGITLPALEAEPFDEHHKITIEQVEDEHFISIYHEMTKTHYISFVAFVTCDRIQFVKFYPEGNTETRLELRGNGFLYAFCNKHGLMKQKV